MCELVLIEPYYNDRSLDLGYNGNHALSLMLMAQEEGEMLGTLAKRNILPRETCLKCGGNHFVKDCLMEALEKIKRKFAWPRVLHHCRNCNIEHLAKDCSSKPRYSGSQTKTFNLVDVVQEPSNSKRNLLRARTGNQMTDKIAGTLGAKKKHKRRSKKNKSSVIA